MLFAANGSNLGTSPGKEPTNLNTGQMTDTLSTEQAGQTLDPLVLYYSPRPTHPPLIVTNHTAVIVWVQGTVPVALASGFPDKVRHCMKSMIGAIT